MKFPLNSLLLVPWGKVNGNFRFVISSLRNLVPPFRFCCAKQFKFYGAAFESNSFLLGSAAHDTSTAIKVYRRHVIWVNCELNYITTCNNTETKNVTQLNSNLTQAIRRLINNLRHKGNKLHFKSNTFFELSFLFHCNKKFQNRYIH